MRVEKTVHFEEEKHYNVFFKPTKLFRQSPSVSLSMISPTADAWRRPVGQSAFPNVKQFC
jgi:hypothetical protein